MSGGRFFLFFFSFNECQCRDENLNFGPLCNWVWWHSWIRTFRLELHHQPSVLLKLILLMMHTAEQLEFVFSTALCRFQHLDTTTPMFRVQIDCKWHGAGSEVACFLRELSYSASQRAGTGGGALRRVRLRWNDESLIYLFFFWMLCYCQIDACNAKRKINGVN